MRPRRWLIGLVLVGVFAAALYIKVGGTWATLGDDLIRAVRSPRLELVHVEVRPTASGLDYGYVVLCTLQNLGDPGTVTVEGVLRLGQEVYRKRQTAYMGRDESLTFQFIFQREVTLFRGLFNEAHGSCRFNPSGSSAGL